MTAAASDVVMVGGSVWRCEMRRQAMRSLALAMIAALLAGAAPDPEPADAGHSGRAALERAALAAFEDEGVQRGLRACLAEHLSKSPGLRGASTRFLLLIGSGGTVKEAAIAREDVDRSDVGACLKDNVRGMKFAAFLGTNLDLSVPLALLDPAGGSLGALNKAEVQRVIRAHRNAIRGCYETALATSPTLAGKVVVRFVIEPAGLVKSAEVIQWTVNTEALESCVTQHVAPWVFPRAGSVEIITYPFLFQVKQ
jgi:hypothetical protein